MTELFNGFPDLPQLKGPFESLDLWYLVLWRQVEDDYKQFNDFPDLPQLKGLS